MSSIQSFHSTMQKYGTQPSIAQRALSWLPYFRDDRAFPIDQEIAALFSELHPVEPGDLAGLAFCRKQLKSVKSPSQPILDAIGRIETLTLRCSLLFLPPSDVLPMFGSIPALRATCSTLARRLSVSSLFQRQKILARAIDGDTHAVRKLAGFIALKCQLNEVPFAKACFEPFYAAATPKAKEQFWRVIFCCGLWSQFQMLLPLHSVEELSFKFNSSKFREGEVIALVSACPNLVSLTIKQNLFIDHSFVDALKLCQKLKNLETRCSASRNKSSRVFASLTNLEELSLGCGRPKFFNDKPVPNFSALSRLKKLALFGYSAESDARATFENLKELKKIGVRTASGPVLASICANKTLQELILDTAQVSHDSLLQEVITLKSLHTLSLFTVQDESMQARFLTSLLQNCTGLRSITLDNNLQGTREEILELQAALAKATQLEHLSIHCEFSSREFAKTLLTLPNLKSLALSLGMIDALKTHGASSNLEKLTYHHPEPEVFEALANLPKLKKVEIWGSYRDEEIKRLASCPALNSITLRGDHGHVTAEGLSSILQIKTVQKCKVLYASHHINLSKALQYIEQAAHIRSVTLRGAQGGNLFRSLRSKKLSHLHTLDIEFSSIRVDGAPADL